jgi:hypothetical protein
MGEWRVTAEEVQVAVLRSACRLRDGGHQAPTGVSGATCRLILVLVVHDPACPPTRPRLQIAMWGRTARRGSLYRQMADGGNPIIARAISYPHGLRFVAQPRSPEPQGGRTNRIPTTWATATPTRPVTLVAYDLQRRGQTASAGGFSAHLDHVACLTTPPSPRARPSHPSSPISTTTPEYDPYTPFRQSASISTRVTVALSRSPRTTCSDTSHTVTFLAGRGVKPVEHWGVVGGTTLSISSASLPRNSITVRGHWSSGASLTGGGVTCEKVGVAEYFDWTLTCRTGS